VKLSRELNKWCTAGNVDDSL